MYDNVQSGFLISYMKPIRRSVNDVNGSLNVDYPLRFSVGAAAVVLQLYWHRQHVRVASGCQDFYFLGFQGPK